jgi:hypothetical protein
MTGAITNDGEAGRARSPPRRDGPGRREGRKAPRTSGSLVAGSSGIGLILLGLIIVFSLIDPSVPVSRQRPQHCH